MRIPVIFMLEYPPGDISAPTVIEYPIVQFIQILKTKFYFNGILMNLALANLKGLVSINNTKKNRDR